MALDVEVSDDFSSTCVCSASVEVNNRGIDFVNDSCSNSYLQFREYRDCIKSRRDKIGITRHIMKHHVIHFIRQLHNIILRVYSTWCIVIMFQASWILLYLSSPLPNTPEPLLYIGSQASQMPLLEFRICFASAEPSSSPTL